MKNVRNHFQEEARQFDEIIIKLIPYYDQMIDALVNALPFDKQQPIRIIDLGCGTGTISLAIKKQFPNAIITCLDMAPNMLEMTNSKLTQYGDDIEYIEAAFADDNFAQKYDAVVSSLALHHLVTDNDKQNYYKLIYESLNPGGVFYNADVILGESEAQQIEYLEKWKEFMLRSVSEEEIENKWLVKYYDEDHPAKLSDHLRWLEQTGFKDFQTIWQYYGGAVFGGVK